MNNNPVVSVIVPCYNHEAYITQCILSIINQSYNNIQLIVIDDGSTDRSYDHLKKLEGEHNFILEHRDNHGLCATLNYAIKKHAIGKYITLIASDDFWKSDKIEKQVSFMENDNHLALSCAKAIIIDKENNIIDELGDEITPESLTFSNLIIKNVIPALTVIFKKEVYDELGGFDENLYFEDWDFWLRIAYKYKLGFLNDYVGFYRKHDQNMSFKSLLMIENSIKVCDKWINHPAYPKAKMELIFTNIYHLFKKSKTQGLKLWLENINYFYKLRYWQLLFNIVVKNKIK